MTIDVIGQRWRRSCAARTILSSSQIRTETAPNVEFASYSLQIVYPSEFQKRKWRFGGRSFWLVCTYFLRTRNERREALWRAHFNKS